MLSVEKTYSPAYSCENYNGLYPIHLAHKWDMHERSMKLLESLASVN